MGLACTRQHTTCLKEAIRGKQCLTCPPLFHKFNKGSNGGRCTPTPTDDSEDLSQC